MVLPSFAQTPRYFQPNTLVELGVLYPEIEINPAGTMIPSLNRKTLSLIDKWFIIH
jgi:hypothetical protein